MNNNFDIHTDSDIPVTELEPILEYSRSGIMLCPHAFTYYKIILYPGTLLVSADVSGLSDEKIHKEQQVDFTQSEFEQILDGIEYLRNVNKQQSRDLIDGGSYEITSSFLNCQIAGNQNMSKWTKFLGLFEKMFAIPSNEQLLGEILDSVSQ